MCNVFADSMFELSKRTIVGLIGLMFIVSSIPIYSMSDILFKQHHYQLFLVMSLLEMVLVYNSDIPLNRCEILFSHFRVTLYMYITPKVCITSKLTVKMCEIWETGLVYCMTILLKSVLNHRFVRFSETSYRYITN